MADQDTEALDILRRLEPTLARVEQRLGRLEERSVNHGERLVRVEATLPTLPRRQSWRAAQPEPNCGPCSRSC
jgi:hypothetical protein